MVGITSFGFYVPVYRLARDEIARAWKTRAIGGEKAVAKYRRGQPYYGCMRRHSTARNTRR